MHSLNLASVFSFFETYFVIFISAAAYDVIKHGQDKEASSVNHFYVWHIRRIKQLLIIIIAAFAAASFLYTESRPLPVF